MKANCEQAYKYFTYIWALGKIINIALFLIDIIQC